MIENDGWLSVLIYNDDSLPGGGTTSSLSWTLTHLMGDCLCISINISKVSFGFHLFKTRNLTRIEDSESKSSLLSRSLSRLLLWLGLETRILRGSGGAWEIVFSKAMLFHWDQIQNQTKDQIGLQC